MWTSVLHSLKMVACWAWQSIVVKYVLSQVNQKVLKQFLLAREWNVSSMSKILNRIGRVIEATKQQRRVKLVNINNCSLIKPILLKVKANNRVLSNQTKKPQALPTCIHSVLCSHSNNTAGVFAPNKLSAPRNGFLAIISLITAYSLFTKRAWAPWLLAVLIITITAFSLDILISVGFTDVLVAVSVLAYLILTWFFSAYVLLKK